MEMIHEAGQYVDTVKRVCEAVGSEVTFRGTVHRVRDMSDFSFVVMRVERGLIQCTFQGDEIGGIKRADVKDAMVLEVTGTVREEPRAERTVYPRQAVRPAAGTARQEVYGPVPRC